MCTVCFFKQKTAYEMRISDWSSDVCSSDLGLLVNRIKAAVAAGTYEIGLETLRAESFAVKAWQTIYTHPGTGAATQLLTIERKERVLPLALDDALALVRERGGELLVNERSQRAAVKLGARSVIDDDGAVHRRDRKSTRLNSSH